jgi:hypothetical protein
MGALRCVPGPVHLPRRRPPASGRRSRLATPARSDARRATGRRRPGAGQSIGAEDGSVQHRLRGSVSLADQRAPRRGPAPGRAGPPQGRGRALAPGRGARSAPLLTRGRPGSAVLSASRPEAKFIGWRFGPAPDHSLSPANLCLWTAETPLSGSSHRCPLATVPDLRCPLRADAWCTQSARVHLDANCRRGARRSPLAQAAPPAHRRAGLRLVRLGCCSSLLYTVGRRITLGCPKLATTD